MTTRNVRGQIWEAVAIVAGTVLFVVVVAAGGWYLLTHATR